MTERERNEPGITRRMPGPGLLEMTTYKLREMSPEQIEHYGLTRYVRTDKPKNT